MFFTQKTLFLAQKVNGKKLTERGGTPPPPLTDGRFPKTERKKVNGKGGTFSVTGGFEPFPYGGEINSDRVLQF